VAGEGFRQQPAAVAAAAWGRAVGRRNAGNQATWGGLRVPKGATRATGRRRARVETRARGGGGNGGGGGSGGARRGTGVLK
jgi:hypothetical protein